MLAHDVYVEKIRNQLERWNTEIDGFQAQARSAAAEAKLEFDAHIANVKGRHQALRERLDALQGAGDESWEELQGRAERALTGFKEALTKARSRFSAH